MTEQEMREMTCPTPTSISELMEFIDGLLRQRHDYGTCVYAMSLSATAVFNYVASELGVTGFQASCAALDILRRTRGLNEPFMLLKGEDALYPQYDLHQMVDEALESWKPWLKEAALKKLEESGHAHPNVLRHWKELAEVHTEGGE